MVDNVQDNIHVSHHAMRRTRERVGIPKKAVERSTAKALKDGVRKDETYGGLRRYLDYLYNRGNCVANNIRVYGGFIYMFHDEILITVLNVPPEHRKQAVTIFRKAKMK